jgi:prolyl oligopeptidase PreP (S9A serine peptidase family)
VEVRSFALHPSGSHMAVAVRRQGVCGVDVYRLAPAGATAAPASAAEGRADGASARSAVLRTNTSSSSGSGRGCGADVAVARTHATAAAAATAAALDAARAASAPAGRAPARLAWVLALGDPTLVLHLQGVATLAGAGLQQQAPAAAAAADAGGDDAWVVLEVSSMVQPSALYYVRVSDPQQQAVVYEEAVPGFQRPCYSTALEWAPSSGGVRVPVTVAYRRSALTRDGGNVAVLHA